MDEARFEQMELDVRDLRERMIQLETTIKSFATREDMANFRVTVETLKEAVKQFATIAESVATKTDMNWIKGFVWKAITAISSILVLIAGIVLSHIYTGHP